MERNRREREREDNNNHTKPWGIALPCRTCIYCIPAVCILTWHQRWLHAQRTYLCECILIETAYYFLI
jgi:hypothetical protein